MNGEAIDREWQQMQFRINQMVVRFLKEDDPSIESKSRSIERLPVPPGYNDDHIEDAT
jgi:hypothetical protein